VTGFGIGLENARKRLSLLYGDQYELNAQPSGDHYTVELVLPDKMKLPEA
jgi:LytS/YehU family sensor histidine kinase